MGDKKTKDTPKIKTKLASGRDCFPREIEYTNKDGRATLYQLVETKRGKLRLEVPRSK